VATRSAKEAITPVAARDDGAGIELPLEPVAVAGILGDDEARELAAEIGFNGAALDEDMRPEG